MNIAEPKSLIMIVDDMVDNLKLLQTLLTSNGYRTAVFPKAELALRSIESTSPDLILLDINMPGMNGYEFCKIIKKRKNLADIPVIYLSAMNELDDKLKAFTSGGIDYIAKPFQFDEVLARVSTHVKLRQQKIELEKRNAQLQQMEQSLEQLVIKRTEQLSASNTQLKASQNELHKLNLELEKRVEDRTIKLQRSNEALEESIRKLKQDEEAGRMVQFKLLPDPEMEISGFEFKHFLQPSLYMSGDFVDYFEVDDEHIVFYLADVSGHGAAPAFVTFLMRSFINNRLTNYWNKHEYIILDPGKLLASFNKSLLEEELDRFITMFYGVINIGSNTLRYSNAGHFPFPFMVTDNAVRQIIHKAPPIGMFEFSEFTNSEIVLPDTFNMTVFSDGVLEIIEEKNIKSQLDVLENDTLKYSGNFKKLISSLDIKKFMPLQDDITILSIKRG
ncbi:response regulator [Lentisphaerota bacterium ZTH]|nr:response regulator [Lentisphaerota bacterium]WET05266.1 response regulator [Lentisphaerota bacterium ZTH]